MAELMSDLGPLTSDLLTPTLAPLCTLYPTELQSGSQCRPGIGSAGSLDVTPRGSKIPVDKTVPTPTFFSVKWG